MQVGFTVKQFRGMFFDRALVEGKIDRASYAVMSKFGARVRGAGMDNFRRGSAKYPVPPKPRNLKGFMRDHKEFGIQFFWDPYQRTVIVGPKIIPGFGDPANPGTKKVERGGTFPRRIRGKNVIQRYREFPFMRDALRRKLPELPGLWRDTIR